MIEKNKSIRNDQLRDFIILRVFEFSSHLNGEDPYLKLEKKKVGNLDVEQSDKKKNESQISFIDFIKGDPEDDKDFFSEEIIKGGFN
jgi:hypothetical protein